MRAVRRQPLIQQGPEKLPSQVLKNGLELGAGWCAIGASAQLLDVVFLASSLAPRVWEVRRSLARVCR